MAKASDNVFPKLIVSEGTGPATPPAGQQSLFLDSSDHKFKRKDSSGAVTTIEGGGSSSATKMPLDPAVPLDSFAGSSLDPAWTLAGSYASGDFTFGDSWIACAVARAAGSYVWRTPPGSWSAITMKATSLCPTNGQAFGILAVDSTGAGVGAAAAYNGTPDGIITGTLVGGVYSSGVQSTASIPGSTFMKGFTHWLRLRKSGTSWFASASLNGVNWSPESTALTNATTITRIGFGGWLGTPASFSLDWFHAA